LILACGESELDLWAVVQELKKRGIKNLLVEGGGEIIGAFLKENLLQEMFVTWTPWALGSGDSVSLTGSAALRPWVKFQVLRAKKVKDEVYFHLKVRGARRV
jgi:2,5-diamino-6-(ribosylamino)-4(3H)-pyrimidinone 5'-phosphate reductase